MLDAVYVDVKEEKRIVAIKPKAPFKPVFQVSTTREGSGVALVHEPDAGPQIADQPPPGGQEADRRFVFVVETGEGRTPRPESAPTRMYYKLIRYLILAPTRVLTGAGVHGASRCS